MLVALDRGPAIGVEDRGRAELARHKGCAVGGVHREHRAEALEGGGVEGGAELRDAAEGAGVELEGREGLRA